MPKTPKYHDKKYDQISAFPHSRKHSMKMLKEMKKTGENKSQLLRRLVEAL